MEDVAIAQYFHGRQPDSTARILMDRVDPLLAQSGVEAIGYVGKSAARYLENLRRRPRWITKPNVSFTAGRQQRRTIGERSHRGHRLFGAQIIGGSFEARAAAAVGKRFTAKALQRRR